MKPNQAPRPTAVDSMHVYEVRTRKDHRGVDLISDALLFTTPSTIKQSYKNHKRYDGRPSDRESNQVANVIAHFIFRFIRASSIPCIHPRRFDTRSTDVESRSTTLPPLT